MNAQILTFWMNKLVKQSGFRHYMLLCGKKLWSDQSGGIAQCPPPKYATALSKAVLADHTVTHDRLLAS